MKYQREQQKRAMLSIALGSVLQDSRFTKLAAAHPFRGAKVCTERTSFHSSAKRALRMSKWCEFLDEVMVDQLKCGEFTCRLRYCFYCTVDGNRNAA